MREFKLSGQRGYLFEGRLLAPPISGITDVGRRVYRTGTRSQLCAEIAELHCLETLGELFAQGTVFIIDSMPPPGLPSGASAPQ